MRRSFLAVTLAAFTGVAVCAAQTPSTDTSTTARAVFRRALDAMGGYDRVRGLTTLTVRARVVHRDDANGADTYEQQDYFRFPDASRTEIREAGQPNALRQIMLNTPEGWWTADGTNPPERHAPPGPPYDPFMLRALLERLTRQSPLPAVAEEDGSETMLQETSDGTATAIEFHFARDTGLLLRRSAVAAGARQEDVQVFYDDYRKVDGFTVPFMIKTQHIGSSDVYTEEFAVLSVTFNPVISGSLFDQSSLKSSTVP